jgi:hypothetical protein
VDCALTEFFLFPIADFSDDEKEVEVEETPSDLGPTEADEGHLHPLHRELKDYVRDMREQWERQGRLVMDRQRELER